MLGQFRAMLHKIGRSLIGWDDDTYINAEQDNAMHEHNKAVEAVQGATAKRREVNDELRTSLAKARRTTETAFTEFERLLEADKRHKKGSN